MDENGWRETGQLILHGLIVGWVATMLAPDWVWRML